MKHMRLGIAVTAGSDNQGDRQRAEILAAQLNLPLVDRQRPAPGELLLVATTQLLELRDTEARPGRGLFVDFSTLHPRQASRRGGLSRNQPLARAIGRDTKRVLDATAGLGHDAALLACMGYCVTAVERSPIIAALLEDGLRRALNDPELREAIDDRLTIIHADARELLVSGALEADAVYIDPMFPPKRKESALAKKSIRLVRELVGADEDAAELLSIARQHCRRVVVKRPTYAPPLAGRPTTSFGGKLARYDVYLSS